MKRTGLNRTSSLSSRGMSRTFKPINKYGRLAKERAERKERWEQDHPPMLNTKGNPYYECHICLYFGETRDIAYVAYERYVLEHIVPKGRLEFDASQEDSNLGPSHVFCNTEKGSLELWQMEKSPKSGLPNPYPTWTAYAEYLLWKK